MGCVKLWILYPGPPNYDVFERYAHQRQILVDIHQQLKGAIFMVTAPDTAITLPPGCIHAVLTLRGGLTPGFIFSSSQSLRVTERVYAMNRRLRPSVGAPEQQAILEGCLMGLRSQDTSLQAFAAQCVCSNFSEFHALSGTRCIFDQVKRAASLTQGCCRCGRSWSHHVATVSPNLVAE